MSDCICKGGYNFKAQSVFDLQPCNSVTGLVYHSTYKAENYSLLVHSQVRLYLFKIAKLYIRIKPFLQVRSQLTYVVNSLSTNYTTYIGDYR